MNEIEENVKGMIDELMFDHVYFNDPVTLDDLTDCKHLILHHMSPGRVNGNRKLTFISNRMVHVGNLRIRPGTPFKFVYVLNGRAIICFNSSEIKVGE